MNKKIKELALKSGFDFDVYGSNDNNFYGWDGRWINSDINNFARLILEECMMVCDKVYEENHHLQIKVGATFCREDIKEHFGIE